MSYFIDLSTVSLHDFFNKIKEVSVLPSQRILRENPEEKLLCLMGQGIHTAEELLAALKTKKQLKAFSEKTGLAEDYLTLLLRELNRYQPAPSRLKDFSRIDKGITDQLETLHITDTRQFFNSAVTPHARKVLAEQAQIPDLAVLELTKLSDLARIMWVTPAFAELLFASGYDCVDKIAEADYCALYQKLILINEGKTYYKGRIGENDIRLLIRYAKDVPPVIVW